MNLSHRPLLLAINWTGATVIDELGSRSHQYRCFDKSPLDKRRGWWFGSVTSPVESGMGWDGGGGGAWKDWGGDDVKLFMIDETGMRGVGV